MQHRVLLEALSLPVNDMSSTITVAWCGIRTDVSLRSVSNRIRSVGAPHAIKVASSPQMDAGLPWVCCRFGRRWLCVIMLLR